jgi:hypothetical protein
MSKIVLTHNLTEPLGSVTTAKATINPCDGNLIIDRCISNDKVLASGTLEYLENQGMPVQSLEMNNGKATLTLKASETRQVWMRLPWLACNGATDWLIHLNPTVSFDLTTHINGGNVTLNLTGMKITHVTADTGGGNMEVLLPANMAGISVAAKSGAGNVTVHVPSGIAARIYATTGLGKVIVDSRFNKIDNRTYQSPDFNSAENKAEITVVSGAGNVTVG